MTAGTLPAGLVDLLSRLETLHNQIEALVSGSFDVLFAASEFFDKEQAYLEATHRAMVLLEITRERLAECHMISEQVWGEGRDRAVRSGQ